MCVAAILTNGKGISKVMDQIFPCPTDTSMSELESWLGLHPVTWSRELAGGKGPINPFPMCSFFTQNHPLWLTCGVPKVLARVSDIWDLWGGGVTGGGENLSRKAAGREEVLVFGIHPKRFWVLPPKEAFPEEEVGKMGCWSTPPVHAQCVLRSSEVISSSHKPTKLTEASWSC